MRETAILCGSKDSIVPLKSILESRKAWARRLWFQPCQSTLLSDRTSFNHGETYRIAGFGVVDTRQGSDFTGDADVAFRVHVQSVYVAGPSRTHLRRMHNEEIGENHNDREEAERDDKRTSHESILIQRNCLFPPHVTRILVLAQTYKPGVPQVVVRGELHEFKLRHQRRREPSAVFHFVRSEAVAPSAAVRLREIGKWAAFDRQALEAFGQLSA